MSVSGRQILKVIKVSFTIKRATAIIFNFVNVSAAWGSLGRLHPLPQSFQGTGFIWHFFTNISDTVTKLCCPLVMHPASHCKELSTWL